MFVYETHAIKALNKYICRYENRPDEKSGQFFGTAQFRVSCKANCEILEN